MVRIYIVMLRGDFREYPANIGQIADDPVWLERRGGKGKTALRSALDKTFDKLINSNLPIIPPSIHSEYTIIIHFIISITTVFPILWIFNQSSLHRIHVTIV